MYIGGGKFRKLWGYVLFHFMNLSSLPLLWTSWSVIPRTPLSKLCDAHLPKVKCLSYEVCVDKSFRNPAEFEGKAQPIQGGGGLTCPGTPRYPDPWGWGVSHWAPGVLGTWRAWHLAEALQRRRQQPRKSSFWGIFGPHQAGIDPPGGSVCLCPGTPGASASSQRTH